MLPRLDEWQLEDVLRALRYHKALVILCALLAGGGAWLFMAQKPDIYQATTRILIETESPRVVKFQEITHTSPWDRSFLMTEYQVISSRAVLSRVIEDLHLSAFPPYSKAKDPVKILQGSIAVIPVRATKLVDIRATGTKPDLVARISNSVANSYAQTNLERRKEITGGGVKWLQEEVDKMESKMREAQLKLQDFREKHGNVDFAEENQNSIFQRLQALNASLTKTREKRIEAETKYREKHPALQEQLTKEKELQLALFEQEQRALEMSRLSIQYTALLRDSKTSEQIYNVLLTRSKELTIQEGLQTNNVQVVDPAQVPDAPVGPPRRQTTVSAIFFGLALGVGLSVMKEMFAHTIRTRGDFERILETPFLGFVPLTGGRLGMGGSEHALLTRGAKQPHVAEALRSIRTTLEFLLPSGQPQVLLVTSALPEEGKSTVCSSLAVSLHELGRSVLIIDADMRRPVLHRTFKLQLEPGLSNFLQESAAPEEIVQTAEEFGGISVVAAGLSPPQPPDLLGSDSFRSLLEAWKREYNYILIDSPPVLVAADSAVLSSMVNGVIYVTRANRTHNEATLAGKQRLVDVGAKLIGGILNGARLEHERGYRYYYYQYYRQGQPRTSRSSARKIPPAQPERASGQEG